jgi:hypothetical protein
MVRPVRKALTGGSQESTSSQLQNDLHQSLHRSVCRHRHLNRHQHPHRHRHRHRHRHQHRHQHRHRHRHLSTTVSRKGVHHALRFKTMFRCLQYQPSMYVPSFSKRRGWRGGGHPPALVCTSLINGARPESLPTPQQIFFLFRPKPSTIVQDCSALQTHGLRQHITVPWYLPAVLTERGHEVVG